MLDIVFDFIHILKYTRNMKFFQRLIWFSLGAAAAAAGIYALKKVNDDVDPWEGAWEKSSAPAAAQE
jgi:hypothetical protein